MSVLNAWGQFIFLYPIVMSIIWMTGACYFYYRYEQGVPVTPALSHYPLVSLMIAAHNEAGQIEETIAATLATAYPNLEVIVIDDGSTDATPEIIAGLVSVHENLRAVILDRNRGKAAALNYGLLFANGEIVITIDADCLLDKTAIHWMVSHFERYPRVGAVTGNPRVRNRTTLLAKLQAAEYASVIGLIKRTQRILGKIMTVSGVIAAFRKKALYDCGAWSTDMVTEDIDVTWKLERRFWAVHYELNAIGWILVPETVSGLWRQRVRWAQGSVEVLRRHHDIFSDWRTRRLWPVYIDNVLSCLWAFSLVTFTLLWTVRVFVSLAAIPLPFTAAPLPNWQGSITALVCFIQFLVSFYLDRRYDSSLFRYYLWVIWYPLVYWLFNAVATSVALPCALLKKKGVTATWVSPDRGLRNTG